MSKNELLDLCKYYRENEPIPQGGDKFICWNAERRWIQESMNDHEDDPFDLEGYMAAGLREFQMYDGVPITLKAALFAYFCKLNDRVLVEEFKKFYKANYS